MSSAQLNINSQSLFRQYLTSPLLIEFMKRAFSNGLLKTHIENALMSKGITNINVATDCIKSFGDKLDIYIIIAFTGLDNSRLCHITFHLIQSLMSEYTNGPLHIVNDDSNRRRQRIHVTHIGTSLNQGIILTPGTLLVPGQHVRCPQIIDTTIEILNGYLNPTHELSLTRDLSIATFPRDYESLIQSYAQLVSNANEKRTTKRTRRKTTHRRNKTYKHRRT